MTNLADDRRLAIDAVRSKLKEQGRIPETVSSGSALEVLDDLARADTKLVAAKWYKNASDHQLNLFEKEWRQWCIDQGRENAHQEHERRRLALRGLQRYLAECALASDAPTAITERLTIEYNGAIFYIYCASAGAK